MDIMGVSCFILPRCDLLFFMPDAGLYAAALPDYDTNHDHDYLVSNEITII